MSAHVAVSVLAACFRGMRCTREGPQQGARYVDPKHSTPPTRNAQVKHLIASSECSAHSLTSTPVLHHAKDEEEAKIFPLARQALGETKALELDAKVLAAKQQLATAN